MKVFEYLDVELPAVLDEARPKIVALGCEGWELVQICPPAQKLPTGVWFCLAWFKREA